MNNEGNVSKIKTLEEFKNSHTFQLVKSVVKFKPTNLELFENLKTLGPLDLDTIIDNGELIFDPAHFNNEVKYITNINNKGNVYHG